MTRRRRDLDDGRHAVAAAEIEHVQPVQRAEEIESGTNPGFVIEISVAIESQCVPMALEPSRALVGLAVVKFPLGGKAIHRGHSGFFTNSRYSGVVIAMPD